MPNCYHTPTGQLSWIVLRFVKLTCHTMQDVSSSLQKKKLVSKTFWSTAHVQCFRQSLSMYLSLRAKSLLNQSSLINLFGYVVGFTVTTMMTPKIKEQSKLRMAWALIYIGLSYYRTKMYKSSQSLMLHFHCLLLVIATWVHLNNQLQPADHRKRHLWSTSCTVSKVARQACNLCGLITTICTLSCSLSIKSDRNVQESQWIHHTFRSICKNIQKRNCLDLMIITSGDSLFSSVS